MAGSAYVRIKQIKQLITNDYENLAVSQ